MLFFKKFLTLINHAFFRNQKFKNYNTSLLKLFFEKSNKVNSSIANLGNTFKNSKWTDFKTQNTKNSLTMGYGYVFGFLTLIIIIPYIFNILPSSWLYSNYWDIINFLNSCYEDFCFWLGLTVWSVNLKLKRWFYGNNNIIFYHTLNNKESVILKKWNFNNLHSNSNLTKLHFDLVKSYYELIEDLNKFNYSKVLYDFKLSLNKDISFEKTGSFYLDILLKALSKNKQHTKINDYQITYLNIHSLETTLVNNVSSSYYSGLNLNNLNNNKISSALIKLDSVNNTFNTSKADRWLTKNSILDRSLTTNNTIYKASSLSFSESNLRNNFSNENLWSSNFYSRYNYNLLNTNRAKFNTFFYNTFSKLSDSRDFFQKRLSLLNQNQTLNYSFFTKFMSNSGLNTNLNHSVLNYQVLFLFKKSYLNLYKFHNNNKLFFTELSNDYKHKSPQIINNLSNYNYIDFYKNYLHFSTSIRFVYKKKNSKTYL